MSGIKAFNDTFDEFIKEISKLFPEYEIIKEFQEKIAENIQLDERFYLEKFTKLVNEPEIAKIIQTEDTDAFMKLPDDKLPMNSFINLKELVDHPNVKEKPDTKKSIWQYLKTLTMFATTVSMLPPDMMQTLDQLASQMATKIESGEINPASIIQNAQNMMLNNPMFSGAGRGGPPPGMPPGMPDLLSMLAPQQGRSKEQRKQARKKLKRSASGAGARKK